MIQYLIIGLIATILNLASAGKFGSRLNRLLIGNSALVLSCFVF
jgi:hypothetical protein